MVDRPFSIREVRGSKPRFSMPEKKNSCVNALPGPPFPFARGWALARCWDHHQRPRASPAPPRGEEQCAVTTSFAAHTAGHHPAHSSPGRRRCAPPVEAQIALECPASSFSFPEGPLCDDLFVRFSRVKWRAHLTRNVGNPSRTRCVRSINNSRKSSGEAVEESSLPSLNQSPVTGSIGVLARRALLKRALSGAGASHKPFSQLRPTSVSSLPPASYTSASRHLYI